jgi:hypothetical protein
MQANIRNNRLAALARQRSPELHNPRLPFFNFTYPFIT